MIDNVILNILIYLFVIWMVFLFVMATVFSYFMWRILNKFWDKLM